MKPINPKDLKIRASQLSKIVALDRAATLTENQKEELEGLLSKIKLTENQAKKRDYLIAKRDAPDQLSKGGKTYIQEIFNEHISGTKRVFSSKYTDKGNQVENISIAEVCRLLGLPVVVKNTDYYENEWTTGTPDVKFIPLSLQMDVKSVYYPHNLDFFDVDDKGNKKLDAEYEWQQHCYNWMLGVDHAIVAKVLLNPPDDILEKEFYSMAKAAGIPYHKIDDDFREEVRDYFDYESRMPLEDRVNVYTLTTEQKHIDQIKKAVELAREYYDELCQQWAKKNNNEVKFVKELIKKGLKR